MRIDIIKEAQHNILEAAMHGKNECILDITYMFVTAKEEHEIMMFLINAMGMLAYIYSTNEEQSRRIIHIGWSHIVFTFDED